MERLLLLLFAVVALLLSGCQADDAAWEATKAEAWNNYRVCLQAAARDLDDGTQDTLTVALAVKARCGPTFLEVARAESARMTPGYADLFIVEASKQQLDSAAVAVANNRTAAARNRRKIN